jgi:prefoldin subunit 4
LQESAGKMMAPEHETEEKEVTAQDQAHINEFSRLNVKYHELEDDLKAKNELLVNLQDSSNEV